ncbi:MAG: hypothetical protein ABIR16_03320 [Dokdonella sp.]
MHRILVSSLLAFAAVPAAHALPNCAAGTLAPPLSAAQTLLAPVAAELSTNTPPLGAPSGVLAHAYDEAQSVDRVLLRLRVQACQNVAMAMPVPGVADPNDPAAYKPKTEFDNTPWRFDMSQNGKRMTADEFDAWMKSRGVRVVKAKPSVAAPVPDLPVEPVRQE